MQQLVVSAGENKELQLPLSEVTLSVYTVPADTKSMYTILVYALCAGNASIQQLFIRSVLCPYNIDMYVCV